MLCSPSRKACPPDVPLLRLNDLSALRRYLVSHGVPEEVFKQLFAHAL